MSNLGGYQKITTWAKRVGGPRNFVIILMTGGAIVGKVSEKQG